MKKIISLLSALTIMMTAFLAVKADTVSIPSDRPHIAGTFIQAWLYGSWSKEQADQEFANMKDIGIQYIVMGDTINRAKNSDGTYSISYESYPSSISLSNYGGRDLVDMILYYCNKYGMKCFLGMGNDTDWSFIYSGHRDDFMNFCSFSASVATDIYNKYKAEYPDAFYGFYFTPELCNCSSFSYPSGLNDCVSFLSDGFNLIIDTLNKLDPTMPLLYSPYANDSSYNATVQSTQKFYTAFYKNTNFRDIDILAPQDSIGAGGITLNELDSWTKMYKDAVTASGKNVHLWSNCEDFVQPKNLSDDWTSADVKRFIQQMQITSKYCEQIITFAYPHYWSPYNTDSGFNRAYIQYLKTGETDSVPPTAPLKVRYDKDKYEDNTAIFQWTPSTDDYDIARYNIYKYNSGTAKFDYVGSNVILRKDGGTFIPKLDTEYYDNNLPQKTIFAIEAMDCAGNYSKKVVFDVDLSQNNNGVDLSTDEGDSGIAAVVDDLNQYAQEIHDGTATTTPSSSITTVSTTTNTSNTTSSTATTSSTTATTASTASTTTTASSAVPTSLSSSASTTAVTDAQSQETTETQNTSGTVANPQTGSSTTATLGILSIAALSIAVTLKRRKSIR